MLDHDAFWFPCGSGGIDDVCEVRGVQADAFRKEICRGHVFPGLVLAVEVEQGNWLADAFEQLLEMSLGEQCDGCAVVEHEAESFGRVAGVERHIGSSGLEHGEQGGDHFEAALHADGDAGIGPDAQLAQVMGEAVGAPVQLGIAELPLFEDQGHGIGSLARLLLEQLMHAPIGGELRPGIVPLIEHAAALGLREHG